MQSKNDKAKHTKS